MSNAVEFSIIGKDEFSKGLNKARENLNKVVKTMAVFGTATAAASVFAAKQIINVGNKTEKLRLRMNAMLGSVAEGNKVFNDMTLFAGQVPFAYDEIMESATQLSGVMEGGSEEINKWMPMIADLAAVSGLSIEKTTEQVVRMYSAGAGAADLFRERGITSMLGFEAGVATTAEETRKKLIEAFEDPASKFRGASMEMAKTWEGIMSMIGDKWFAMRSQMADAGLFNYFKAIATTLDKLMGGALQNTANNAAKWSDFIIDGIRSVVKAVGSVADTFQGLRTVWSGLKVLFSGLAEGIVKNIYDMAEGWRLLLNLIPGVDLAPMEKFSNILQNIKNRTKELGGEFEDNLNKPMPSEGIDDFMSHVEMTFTKFQEKSAEMRDAVIKDQKEITKITLEELDKRTNKLQESNQKQIDLMIEYASNFGEIYDLTMTDIFNNAKSLGQQTSDIIKDAFDNITSGIGNAIATAIVDGESLGEALKNVLKNVVKNIIASYITMKIQRAILAGTFTAASFIEAKAALASGFAQTYVNAFAATSAIPIIGPSLAPGVASASLEAAQAGAIVSGSTGGPIAATVVGAHGGMTNVPAEATYFLNKGERVFSPNQNKDFTDFIKAYNSEEGLTGNGSVTIESLSIHILENATSAEALLEMDASQMEEVVAGPIIDSLNSLARKGVAPERIGDL